MKIAQHALLLTITIFFATFFARTSLRQYDISIAILLFMVLFVLKRLTLPSSPVWKITESIVFTFVSVYIVMATGRASSPFFFLLYFLLFSLSLMLEPAISLTTTLVLVMVLIASLSPQPTFSLLLPIFSLAFLTPFAMLLGQEYSQMQDLEKKNKKEEKLIQELQEVFEKKITSMEKSLDSLKDSDAKTNLTKDLRTLRSYVDTH